MAHHKVVSRHRWQLSQRHELKKWTGQRALGEALSHIHESYVPYMLKYTQHLGDDAKILEIGSGPACISKLIEKGHKTFLDPLLDDFRRAYPGELPEGRYLTSMAENVPCADQSFDCIVCINALGYVMNPELVLNEMERLLKPDGIMIIGMTVFSGIEARLHYFISRCLPSLGPEGRPYCYSYVGIRRSLERHFDIHVDVGIKLKGGLLSSLDRRERLFVCSHKGARPALAE